MAHMDGGRRTVLTLFGTRPEIIKLAPVIRGLEATPAVRTCNVLSGQHADLPAPFIRLFGVRVDRELEVMECGRSLNQLACRIVKVVDDVLAEERPDLVLVQGDTTTAMAGALAAFHRHISVGHVEAGLRSGDPWSPWPEEVNRRLISSLARHHFAPTERNRATLLREGICPDRIHVTGNPVVDALREILATMRPSEEVERLVRETEGARRIVLTTHRRESFGERMRANLRVVRRFVEEHGDVAVFFPVHPNPEVRAAVVDALGGAHDRIRLLPPLGYSDFIHLLSQAWLIVSDSGGIQEEAPTLKKPVLVLRDSTERPEVVECGVARLTGGNPQRLHELLEETHADSAWSAALGSIDNPFGSGDAGRRIAAIVDAVLAERSPEGAR
jgi:UDP-N-acetylglucosamine 2-epimerase (non-hydrolysing)